MLRFIDSLATEFALLSPQQIAIVKTVYIGGGTPSVLPIKILEKFLAILEPAISVASEVTCEVNPDSAGIEKMDILKSCGVNRLSIGMQSFDDDILKRLGRIGDSKTGKDAFSTARDAGFDNISVDLMYGIPGQDMAGWVSDLQTAVELGPMHISFYGLTLEEGTEFEKTYADGKFTSDEMFREMYFAGLDFLKEKGYLHYEISNFAKPGHESRHNLNYWKHGTYAGLGPSAAGFDGKSRWKNVSDTQKYIDLLDSGKKPLDETEDLTQEQMISESLMLGLRLIDGVNITELSERFGINLGQIYAEPIERLQARGMIERAGDMLRLTREGLFISDSVICDFILV